MIWTGIPEHNANKKEVYFFISNKSCMCEKIHNEKLYILIGEKY